MGDDRMRKVPLVTSFFLIASMLALPQANAANAKAGGICARISATSVVSGIKFTCTKSGNKLIWKKNTADKKSSLTLEQKLLNEFISKAKSAINDSNNYLPTYDAAQTVKIDEVSNNNLPHFLAANTSGKFTYLGPTPLTETDSTRTGAVSLLTKDQGAVYGSRSALPPWAATFNFTTTDANGRFIVVTSGQDTQERPNYFWRLAFKTSTGLWKYQSINGTSHSKNGNQNFDQVTLGAPGTYSIHLEFENATIFHGIGLSDETTAIDSPSSASTPRVIILGDSWVYPVFNEKGKIHAWDAFPGALSWLTGWNVISAGVPGQGYVQVAAGETYKDRVVRDLVPQEPDVVIFTGSPNDHCEFCTVTDQQIANKMGAAIKLLKAANPKILIIACSPFEGSPTQADAMKTVADSLGVAFINFISQPLFNSTNNGKGQLSYGHPTRLGSGYIAKQMLKSLASLKN